MKKFIISLFVLFFIIAPTTSVFAAAKTGFGLAINNLQSVTNDTGLESELGTTLGTVVQTALALVGTIFLILTIYAGILWMTAAGKDDQMDKARKIITASIIGLFITLSAYAITYFITTKLGGI